MIYRKTDNLRAVQLLLGHTKVDTTVRYAAAKAKAIAFVDAPVSGGQAGAEKGAPSIMCGGDQADYDRAEPAMNVYAKLCRRIGQSGAGQMSKMCNQIAIAGLVQGLSEALHFASKAGLDGAAVVKVSVKVQPDHGNCRTVTRRCWTITSNMVLQLIGCAKTLESAFQPLTKMARRCL